MRIECGALSPVMSLLILFGAFNNANEIPSTNDIQRLHARVDYPKCTRYSSTMANTSQTVPHQIPTLPTMSPTLIPHPSNPCFNLLQATTSPPPRPMPSNQPPPITTVRSAFRSYLPYNAHAMHMLALSFAPHRPHDGMHMHTIAGYTFALSVRSTLASLTPKAAVMLCRSFTSFSGVAEVRST
jgi:hypothetical protein